MSLSRKSTYGGRFKAMPSNNNAYGNGYYYHRCDTGIIFREDQDVYYLMCGFRLTFVFSKAAITYMVEAVIARLVYGDIRDIDDLKLKHWQMVEMAAK